MILGQSTAFANHHPLYIGVLTGYGTTTWSGLTPTKPNRNGAISISTPIRVEEGGAIWGVLSGYEFSSHFAVEASYIQYPRANITFDEMSLFNLDHNGLNSFYSDTDTVNLLAKFLVDIPNTNVRVYSSAGATGLHRDDLIVKDGWMASPSFGVGVNIRFDEHLMAELAGLYTAGYGDSRLSPSDSFYPFLGSVSLRIAYCI